MFRFFSSRRTTALCRSPPRAIVTLSARAFPRPVYAIDLRGIGGHYIHREREADAGCASRQQSLSKEFRLICVFVIGAAPVMDGASVAESASAFISSTSSGCVTGSSRCACRRSDSRST